MNFFLDQLSLAAPILQAPMAGAQDHVLAAEVCAAGGIVDAAGVQAAKALGASAVQIGTAYLACPESTISALHRSALRSPAARHTALTNLLSLNGSPLSQSSVPTFPSPRTKHLKW